MRILLLLFMATSSIAQTNFTACMPRSADRTSLWWRDAHPGNVSGAAWRRVLETGFYRLVLDTEAVSLPRLGSVKIPWNELGGADLHLELEVDGTSYRCRGAKPASRFGGPRLIEGGRFLHRMDITDLVFESTAGDILNAEGRVEFTAWPDRLGILLEARPGLEPMRSGEASFGRLGGGFGLDGTNRFVIPPTERPGKEAFTIAFWTFVPTEFSDRAGWLLCGHDHEAADGHVGVYVHQGGKADVRMNLGGGAKHTVVARSRHALRFDQWNHVAVSYDGKDLRLALNGQTCATAMLGKPYRPSQPGSLTFGRRGDGRGTANFIGVVDEILLFDRRIDPRELQGLLRRPETPPAAKRWSFREQGTAAMERPRTEWKQVDLRVEVKGPGGVRVASGAVSGPSPTRGWHRTWLMMDPVRFSGTDGAGPVTVRATEPGGRSCPVTYEPEHAWHRIDLDPVRPVVPPGTSQNDSMERVRLRLENPGEHARVARLLFKKNRFQQRIGTPITGVTAVLRDVDGHPTGLPVQLSKNWHNHPNGGIHSGQWFHGISQVRLPPRQVLELELCIVYGHWGGLPAATHSQLSLIGWGGNGRWDQCALGAWGESICLSPDFDQAGGLLITDVRPLMVTPMNGTSWNWTQNVGGGDIFRLYAPDGSRVFPAGLRTDYRSQGPCLTDVRYQAAMGGTGVHTRLDVGLARTDDLLRTTFRIRMDASRDIAFSRFAIFQLGSDNYATTRERALAVGNAEGLVAEWKPQWGGDRVKRGPMALRGLRPWVSMHQTEGNPSGDDRGARANRGLVLRAWKARLGGQAALPHLVERGLERGHPDRNTSFLELVPPPGVTRLQAGDFVEAVVELLVVPQAAADYYGPNEALRQALSRMDDTWKMVHREAEEGHLDVSLQAGTLERPAPGLRIRPDASGEAVLTIQGGVGAVPVTFTGLPSHRDFELSIDGRPFDTSVHGRDFWQTDFDPESGQWSRTYNLPGGSAARRVRFTRK